MLDPVVSSSGKEIKAKDEEKTNTFDITSSVDVSVRAESELGVTEGTRARIPEELVAVVAEVEGVEAAADQRQKSRRRHRAALIASTALSARAPEAVSSPVTEEETHATRPSCCTPTVRRPSHAASRSPKV